MPNGGQAAATYDSSIFFNCPFDDEYKPIFDALIFAAVDCGYVARCALDIDDGAQVRLEKIIEMIRACRLGVHDISRTEIDPELKFPRFNMPFELGLFVAAGRFGIAGQRRKICLILDRERDRFRRFLSDIAGQDIKVHRDQPEMAIKALRTWLSAIQKREMIPGGAAIVRRYQLFRAEFPALLSNLELEADEVTFNDYLNIVAAWLAEQPRTRR